MRVGIIGTGSMGSVLARALLETNVVTPDNLWLFNRTASKSTALVSELGVNHLPEESAQAHPPLDCLVLAVKPKDVTNGCRFAQRYLAPDVLFVSLLAGIPIPRIAQLLDGHRHLVRAMPNIASVVGEGITVWCPSESCTSEDKLRAKQLFEALGVTYEVISDELVDVGTALFGSGPAYILFVAQHLRDVAVELGLPKETALKLVGQLLMGSSQLILKDVGTPEELRRSVTSPNGTTAAGMERLAQGHVGSWIRDAVKAALLRAKALARS